MLSPRTHRYTYAFDLDDDDGRREYEAVLNNPRMRILSKKFATQSETTSDEDSSTTVTRQFLYVDAEEVTL